MVWCATVSGDSDHMGHQVSPWMVTSDFTSLLLDLRQHRLRVGVVRLAVRLSQAAFAGVSFWGASDRIRCSAYAEAAAESDASGADWSHRDFAEGHKHFSSCALTAEGIPSVQVGLE